MSEFLERYRCDGDLGAAGAEGGHNAGGRYRGDGFVTAGPRHAVRRALRGDGGGQGKRIAGVEDLGGAADRFAGAVQRDGGEFDRAEFFDGEAGLVVEGF